MSRHRTSETGTPETGTDLTRTDAPRTDEHGRHSRLDLALLPFFGPAQVHSVHAVGTVSREAVQREADLRVRFERVVGPDGHAYVVERRD